MPVRLTSVLRNPISIHLAHVLRAHFSPDGIPGYFKGLHLELRRRAGLIKIQNRRRPTPSRRAFTIERFAKKRGIPYFYVRSAKRFFLGRQAPQPAVGHVPQSGALRHYSEFPLLRKLRLQ